MKRKGTDIAVFDRALQKWVAYWKPDNPLERDLVNSLARYEWLIHRVLNIQDELFAENGGQPVPELAQLLRYQATQEKAYMDCVATLQEIHNYERSEANGFVSQKGIKVKKSNSNEGNPWMNMDLDPETECGWADPITGKFTPFGDGFATEVAEEKAREQAEQDAKQEREPAA